MHFCCVRSEYRNLKMSHINTLTVSHLKRIIERKGFTNTKRKRKKCLEQSINFVLDAASHFMVGLMLKLVRRNAGSVFSVSAKFIVKRCL